MFKDTESVNFLSDETVQKKLANAKKISEVSAKDYDAIFYVGGHGPVIDLPVDPDNSKLASDVCFLLDDISLSLSSCSFTKLERSPQLFATDLRKSRSILSPRHIIHHLR